MLVKRSLAVIFLLSFTQLTNWLLNGPGLGTERAGGLKEDASILAIDTREGYVEWKCLGFITGPTQSRHSEKISGGAQMGSPIHCYASRYSAGLGLLVLEAPASSWVTHGTALFTFLTCKRWGMMGQSKAKIVPCSNTWCVYVSACVSYNIANPMY